MRISTAKGKIHDGDIIDLGGRVKEVLLVDNEGFCTREPGEIDKENGYHMWSWNGGIGLNPNHTIEILQRRKDRKESEIKPPIKKRRKTKPKDGNIIK